MDHVCHSTNVLFTVSSIVQMGLVVKVLTPPSTCMLSCLTAMACGVTLPTAFIVANHILKSEKTLWIEKIYKTIPTLAFPFASSFFTNYLLATCRDPFWTSWFLQGCTLPAVFISVYRLLFSQNS